MHARGSEKKKGPIQGGRINGCSTITTSLHIHSPLINRKSLAKHIKFVPQLPIFATPHTNRLLLVSKVKIHTERSNFESDDNTQEN
jgi:hypothetical protein